MVLIRRNALAILGVASLLLVGCGSSPTAKDSQDASSDVQVLGAEVDQDGPVTTPQESTNATNRPQLTISSMTGEELCSRFDLQDVKKVVDRDDLTASPIVSANGEVCRFVSNKNEVGFDVGYEPSFVEYQANFGVSANFFSTSEFQYVTAAGKDDRIVSMAMPASGIVGVLVFRQSTLANVWLDRDEVVDLLS